jgi:hypothetical protein
MEKKRPSRRPTKRERELDRLQIEEYIATNPHGPGDHGITLAEFVLRAFGKPKD